MYVTAHLLRRFGRKVPDGPTISGRLVVSARRGTLVAEVRGPGPVTNDPLARLWDARLVEVDRVIRLRGYEPSAGAGMLQEWECRVVPERPVEFPGIDDDLPDVHEHRARTR